MLLNIDTLLGFLKRAVISCLIVTVCAMTSSAWVQAQSSASSLIPVLSLLLLSDGELSHVVEVANGAYHSCARLSNGTVKCWGANDWGQLGNGTTRLGLTPVSVRGITTATAIATGGAYSCALLSNGTVKCWGSNYDGQLGDGTFYARRLTPVSVCGITTATAITAGKDHSCARFSNGIVKCWGSNYDGQLGDGTAKFTLTPVTVSGITTATAIATGQRHSCSRLSNGTVKCWGRNTDGQLGDGTTTNRPAPVRVSDITTATTIATGYRHSCAPLSNGKVKCWGQNSRSQLGDGTKTNRHTPVLVRDSRN